MPTIVSRLNERFQRIIEEEVSTDWKDPNSPDYDRQWAEDALFHTIGPLTDHPHWVNSDWSSPSEPVPGFILGGPAPRWSPDEIIFAFAGDPNMLFTAKNNPRSPMYGNKGGAPLFRVARKVARYYNRSNDRQFIADLYSNGFIPLVRMMKPGFDEGRSPFISYAIRNIQSAMEHGTGGTSQSNLATGRENQHGVVGLSGLLERSDPREVRTLAHQVKGKYQEEASHDKHPDNPFGKYSAAYFRLANDYADALEAGDEDRIDAARNRIRQQISEIEDENVFIPGASTGMGQAISTPDRKTSIGIASMDAARGNDEEAGMAGNIAGEDEGESNIDPETIYHMYDIAINYDLGEIIGNIPKYADLAAEWGAKGGKIGGKMTVNELRYSIRTMGPLGSNYPGRGTVRANPQIPRDSKGWWEPGSDPEIEPIPRAQNALWHSTWVRKDFPSMGPTEISQEMTKEVMEFNKLGITTARKVKSKIDSRSGRQIQEVISKVAVANTMKAATVKLKFIAMLERDMLGLQESKQKHPLLEDIQQSDPVDRELVAEACDYAVSRIERVLNEDSPKGWKGSIHAMLQKHPDEFSKEACDDDSGDKMCPYAIANAMKKKGAKPHYKDKVGKPEHKNESKMLAVDAIVYEETQ